jgi:hypothetical protein
MMAFRVWCRMTDYVREVQVDKNRVKPSKETCWRRMESCTEMEADGSEIGGAYHFALDHQR